MQKETIQRHRPLTTIIPIAIVCSMLVGFQHLQAQWNPAPASPPNSNVDAPINTGTTDQVKDGGLSVNALSIYGHQLIEHEYPIIRFDETDGMQWRIHVNTQPASPEDMARFIIQADRNKNGNTGDDGSNTRPLKLYAFSDWQDDYAQFAYGVHAEEYCDRNGNDCFTPATVSGAPTISNDLWEVRSSAGSSVQDMGSPSQWDICFLTIAGPEFTNTGGGCAIDRPGGPQGNVNWELRNFKMNNDGNHYCAARCLKF